MVMRKYLLLAVCLLASTGCGTRKKSTTDLLADLKGPEEKEQLIAVRLLPQHREDSAQIIPALIEALHYEESDLRSGAAWGLGSFGEEAKDAIPMLRKLEQHDRDARVRKAAVMALSRIELKGGE